MKSLEKMNYDISKMEMRLKALKSARDAYKSVIDEYEDAGGYKYKRYSITIQDMCLGVMKKNECNSTKAIQNKIVEKYNNLIPRESLSPQLSRLKQKGIIENNNNLWVKRK